MNLSCPVVHREWTQAPRFVFYGDFHSRMPPSFLQQIPLCMKSSWDYTITGVCHVSNQANITRKHRSPLIGDLPGNKHFTYTLSNSSKATVSAALHRGGGWNLDGLNERPKVTRWVRSKTKTHVALELLAVLIWINTVHSCRNFQTWLSPLPTGRFL